ncbi:MAG: phosphodiesterase [Gammaproteobacteria bacterium]|nr:phosphodiesterase [Gammaproteobacteria bacterium]MBU0829764.1 phosphodiesterase [Gammaproteobacteria bacterium]MBU0893601.1 phosphodiesterase [Gammaproteobacteria bacterium]MBU1818965.1 phosphodiesterase [Gammaproteobacteria bacterium]
MLIAQLSDMHIKANGKLAYGVVDTAGLLRECVTDIVGLATPPDVILITGDLVDYGRPEEYALLNELLAPLTMPMYVVAGNHDERTALRKAFNGPRFDYLSEMTEFLQYAVDLGPLRLLVLDTVVPDEGRGQLCDRRLAWLDARLAEDSRPTVIAMHHPPFATGIAHMDAVGLEGADALEKILLKYRHVERVVCGHLHRSIQCRFGGTVASTCPSPAHQVALDLSPEGPDCFVMEPPGYQLHTWLGGRLVTHTCVVGSFAGPYRFRKGGVLID